MADDGELEVPAHMMGALLRLLFDGWRGSWTH
jgi:hypothetical protein